MIESESELLNFKETVGRGKQLVHSCCIRAGSQAAPQPEKENRPAAEVVIPTTGTMWPDGLSSSAL